MRLDPASVVTTLPSSPPLTMRSPSAAVASIAPSWIALLRISPSGSANNSACSLSAKTGVRPRKCTATTAPPAATNRVRSATETMSLRVSVIGCNDSNRGAPKGEASGDTALEPVGDLFSRQVAADEDDAALAFLVLAPRALVIAIEDHVHALKDKALIVILEGEDALATQNARAFFLHQVLDPGEKLIGVERLVATKRDRLHLLVVVVLQPAVRMLVIVVVVVIAVLIAVLMTVVVLVAIEKCRLQIENAIEVKGAAVQNRVERNLGTFGL